MKKTINILSYVTYSILALVIAPIGTFALGFILLKKIHGTHIHISGKDMKILYIYYAMYLILMIPKVLVTIAHDMKQN